MLAVEDTPQPRGKRQGDRRQIDQEQQRVVKLANRGTAIAEAKVAL